MSSLKFDEESCSNVITDLNKAKYSIEDIVDVLSAYINDFPTITAIDNSVESLSLEVNRETGETEKDDSKFNYYNNACAEPLKNAMSNIKTLKSALSSIALELSDLDSRFTQISALVSAYENSDTSDGSEEEPFYRNTSGSADSGGGGYGNYPLNSPSVNSNNGSGINTDIDTSSDGKSDQNADKDGDGLPDLDIDKNTDGESDQNGDKDGGGLPDLYIDKNTDG